MTYDGLAEILLQLNYAAMEWLGSSSLPAFDIKVRWEGRQPAERDIRVATGSWGYVQGNGVRQDTSKSTLIADSAFNTGVPTS